MQINGEFLKNYTIDRIKVAYKVHDPWLSLQLREIDQHFIEADPHPVLVMGPIHAYKTLFAFLYRLAYRICSLCVVST